MVNPQNVGEQVAHENSAGYVAVAGSDEFAELRRTFRRFVFPMTGLFLAWYFLYVLMSNYAGGFMDTKVIGNIHVGLVFGLLEFVSTFAITIAYARWADRTLDPIAAELGSRVAGPDLAGRSTGGDAAGNPAGTDRRRGRNR